MADRSIRFRLVLTALIAIFGAMAIAVYGLTVLFERHVERRVVAALEADMRQLIAGLTIGADGSPTLQRRPSDPRYDQPLSGSYWLVLAGPDVLDRSRSLWDETLALPPDDPTTGLHQHFIKGPQGRALVAVERAVRVERAAEPITLRFAVAQDRSETIAAVASFSREIVTMLVLLGGLMLAAFGLAVTVGLLPLGKLRTDLGQMRGGGMRRLTGRYPAEVALLVGELNKLLDARDGVAERNRQRAADLAHGLKTPITAIATIADELRAAGKCELADELRDYTAAMQQHVERELALARSLHAGTTEAPTVLRPLVAAIVRSLERLPRGAEIAWSVDVPATLAIAADPAALAEVTGGILDNARKWARGRVDIRARVADGMAEITVFDDGPGVAPDKLASLTARGLRLDQKKPGSGLGLAIASEIVTELGGTIEFGNAADGGFIATVSLPVDGRRGRAPREGRAANA